MKKDNPLSLPFCIYGAGIVASSIYTAWKALYHVSPECFLVTSIEDNPRRIDGIPVKSLEEINHQKHRLLYAIAAPEVHHSAIIKLLRKQGINDEQILPIDNKLENAIMEEYYAHRKDFLTAKEVIASYGKDDIGNVDIQVYQAKCHMDKPLTFDEKPADYISPLQVGASLTNQRIATLLDNQGKNISEKNRNYCELTATYWVWKNRDIAYKGLCHYRRIFDLSDKEIQILFGSSRSIDVILPYPVFYYPGMRVEHLRYVDESDWRAMLKALKTVAPDYDKAYESIADEPYFYNYNMLIARREIFDDYSSFLFAVLEETERNLAVKEMDRADRFAGYLAENLTTIYFRANREKYKIAHAGKLWLV